ncbi:MAG: FAD-dependent oxidoreductase [Faecousia sp.]
MESLWKATANMPQFSSLRGDLDTDVLIIGGGMAGVLCAYALHQAGVNYVLAEAKEIGSGVTACTTAKITTQHGIIYHKLGKQAAAYYRANQQAVEDYRALCRGIDCDFEEKDAFVYSLTDFEGLQKEVAALEALGASAELVNNTELPFPVAGLARLGNQAQFHPLKFLAAISKGLHILENTRVSELVGTTAVTPKGKIWAKRVVVATHFPFLNKHGSYFLKMYQHRSYVLALEGVKPPQGMYVSDKKTGLSFRSAGDLLLLGGDGHRTGKKGGGWEELRSFAREHYPNAKEVHRWATQDCMTLDNMPYIGPYSASTKGLYVATGFNKWGMTGSMVAARVLSEILQGKPSPYGELFSPSRSMLKPQLAANGAQALAGWLTPTVPRCPHLGCTLKWNPQEHSWDCPCHGSRFAGDGKLLDGPATGNLKKP